MCSYRVSKKTMMSSYDLLLTTDHELYMDIPHLLTIHLKSQVVMIVLVMVHRYLTCHSHCVGIVED